MSGNIDETSDWVGLGNAVLHMTGHPREWSEATTSHMGGKVLEAINDLHHVYVDATLESHRERLLRASAMLMLYAAHLGANE
jgi:hypothetical protein